MYSNVAVYNQNDVSQCFSSVFIESIFKTLSSNYDVDFLCRSYVFCKKGVLKNFAKFTGKHLCQSLFFNKVAGKKRESGTGVFL